MPEISRSAYDCFEERVDDVLTRFPEMSGWLAQTVGQGVQSEAAKWIKRCNLDPRDFSTKIQSAFDAGDFGDTARARV